MLRLLDQRTAARAPFTSTPAHAIALSLIALCSSAPAGAGTNQFTQVGPDGGFIRQVQFHPSNPLIMHALTTGGYYRSTDSGLHWQLVGQSLHLQFAPEDLAIDPTDPDHIIAAVPGDKPLVSTDAGATLTRSATTFPLGSAGLRHVEFSADGSVVYGAAGVRVVRSTDSGRTWSERMPVTGTAASELQFLRVDPLDPNVVYVFDLNQGGFRSTNGGASWQPIALPANSSDLAISNTTPQRIWATSFATGIHRSTDGGASFPAVFPGGGIFGSALAVALDPHDQSVVYASLGSEGVVRSPDDGNHWATVTGDARIGLITSLAVNPFDASKVALGGQAGLAIGVPETAGIGGTWQRRDQGILATDAAEMSAASSGRIYINTVFSGVHFLANGSAATTPVNNSELQDLQPSFTQSHTLGLLSQSRGASDRLFVGMSTGYARSEDSGVTWQPGSTTGFNNPGDVVVHFAASPLNPDLIVASTAPGMHRSLDGGDTWAPADTGLPAQAMASALVSSSAAPNTFYAGIQTVGGNLHGVYASIDGGATWSPANAGFATAEIRALAVDPTNAQVVYAAAAANDQGLLKSTNGGASWSQLNWPSGAGGAHAVAVDPHVPGIVYVAAFNGIARSVDSGATWQTLRSNDPRPDSYVSVLLADPRRAGTVLASTINLGVIEMTVAPNLELAPGVAPPSQVVPGAQATYRYRVRNLGAFDATGVHMVVTLPADATGVSATTTNGSCDVQMPTATCTAPTLLAGAEANIVVNATHPTEGTLQVAAAVSGDQTDPVSTDDELVFAVTVAQVVSAPPPPPPPTPPPSPPSSGGGGGTSSLLGLLALAALSLVQRRRFMRDRGASALPAAARRMS